MSNILLFVSFVACLVAAAMVAPPVPPVSRVPQVSATPHQFVAWTKEKAEAGLGPVDGKNVTYVLTYAPEDTAELMVFAGGLYMSEGNDYKVVGKHVIFVVPQAPGTLIRFFYRAVL